MTCVPFSSSALCMAPSHAPTRKQATLAMLVALTSTMLLAPTVRAQQPLSVPAMHAPLLQLVQPSSGGSVPTDRPVVFFRYGPGEPTDPIDDASFQIWLDGAERTSRFRIGNGEAWGTLAAVSSTSGPGSTSRASAPRGGTVAANAKAQLTAGAHLVTARVCSVRGVCSTLRDILVAVPVTAVVSDTTNVVATPRAAMRRRHSHLKQPWTLVGDLVANVAKVLRP